MHAKKKFKQVSFNYSTRVTNSEDNLQFYVDDERVWGVSLSPPLSATLPPLTPNPYPYILATHAPQPFACVCVCVFVCMYLRTRARAHTHTHPHTHTDTHMYMHVCTPCILTHLHRGPQVETQQMYAYEYRYDEYYDADTPHTTSEEPEVLEFGLDLPPGDHVLTWVFHKEVISALPYLPYAPYTPQILNSSLPFGRARRPRVEGMSEGDREKMEKGRGRRSKVLCWRGTACNGRIREGI